MELSLSPDQAVTRMPRDSAQRFRALDVEVDELVRIPEARARFAVTGAGLSVAVLDTGLRVTHRDFAGRVVASANFTGMGADDDVTDRQGHGTNVAGIIAAAGVAAPMGVAPGAGIIPLKVLGDGGQGSFEWLRDALAWVSANAIRFNIGVACLSLGSQSNYTRFDQALSEPGQAALSTAIRRQIQQLAELRTVVVVAAGNDYSLWKQQGMSFPAIIPETISVGAAYDHVFSEPVTYCSGAIARTGGPDRLTPFSQRLHPAVDTAHATDVFAPGAPIRSAGSTDADALSIQSGTSQATPVIAGLVLLLQHHFLRRTGTRPSLEAVVRCLKAGSVAVVDGDDEDDNVPNTGLAFLRPSAPMVLEQADRLMEGSFGMLALEPSQAECSLAELRRAGALA